MTRPTPYAALPDHCFWSRSHRVDTPRDVDPVVSAGFRVNRRTKIATAGSCFAQHIARHLKGLGYNYLVTEKAHPIIDDQVAQLYNYGTFSARYGNIYTARQLLQLAQRAYGTFNPVEDIWEDETGHTIDPFRPNVQPGGFERRDDFLMDRKRHYAAVRELFETCDVFVFTLGLTEAWASKQDGAVFPLCPGVAGGTFNANRHEFVNFTVDEIVADFQAFYGILADKNPKVKVLLTVSPVPLIATARADQSVLSATTYSKSVLRVAAEQLQTRNKNVHYFPSYEVITGTFNRGKYYAEDYRDVTKEGVDHVMSLFLKHYTRERSIAEVPLADETDPETVDTVAEVQEALDTICDEELIDVRVGAERSARADRRPPRRNGQVRPRLENAGRRIRAAAAAKIPAQDVSTVPSKDGDRQHVIGLYSFPKSGNTWLRAIIAAAFQIPAGPGNLQRYVTDTHYGKVMENPWIFKGAEWYFYKSHHKKVLGSHKGEDFPTNKVLYIYRNPLDVFVSYLNFVSNSVSPRSGRGLPFEFEKVEDLTPDQLAQLFGIYLEHGTIFPKNTLFGGIFESISSFKAMQARGDDVYVLRYEDLKDDFAGTVEPMLKFVGLEVDEMDAVFEGADSRTKQNGKFFWKRKKNNYLEFLTPEQIDAFYERHGTEMNELGYER